DEEKIHSPIRIVFIADLHDREFGKGNERLIERMKELDPDLILMVGDLINDSSENLNVATHLIESLQEVAPIYVSMGNQELAYEERTGQDVAEELAGAVVLDLAYQDIQINGQRIRLGGIYDYAFALNAYNDTKEEEMDPEVYQFLREFEETEDFTIMMSHMPESFVLGEASKTWKIDLVVSGHDHGGQVILPFLGGLWGCDQGYFPKYVYGYHEKDLLNILITSGLGSKNEKLPRFHNPPEIVELILK
ncbi:MAG: metallophosphoesterase, partial [Lachnospiraceae bacterium]